MCLLLSFDCPSRFILLRHFERFISFKFHRFIMTSSSTSLVGWLCGCVVEVMSVDDVLCDVMIGHGGF